MATDKPTFRQKKTLKIMVENGGKVTPAAIKAGFSKAYAESGKLQKTLTWQQLMDKHFPESKLAAVLQRGLDSKRSIVVDKTVEEVEDRATQHRYLETAMKARGKLTEKVDVTSEGEKVAGFVVVKTEPAPSTVTFTPTTISTGGAEIGHRSTDTE